MKTAGFGNPKLGVTANITPWINRLIPGHVAVVSQSGSMNLILASNICDQDGLEMVADTLVHIGQFMLEHPEIREMDLNPVRVYPDRLMVLDALIVMGNTACEP